MYTKELLHIYTFTVDGSVIGMRYGLYGRENDSLVVVHGRGSITLKLIRRRAELLHVVDGDHENETKDEAIPGK